MNNKLSQIRLKKISEHEFDVYVNQHNFHSGRINTKSRIYFHKPRSSKNVFHLFQKDSLGINSEILHLDLFDKIMIKFNGNILETSRKKWAKKGISSPFSNNRVDHQILLFLDEINLDYTQEEVQENLFQEVV